MDFIDDLLGSDVSFGASDNGSRLGDNDSIDIDALIGNDGMGGVGNSEYIAKSPVASPPKPIARLIPTNDKPNVPVTSSNPLRPGHLGGPQTSTLPNTRATALRHNRPPSSSSSSSYSGSSDESSCSDSQSYYSDSSSYTDQSSSYQTGSTSQITASATTQQTPRISQRSNAESQKTAQHSYPVQQPQITLIAPPVTAPTRPNSHTPASQPPPPPPPPSRLPKSTNLIPAPQNHFSLDSLLGSPVSRASGVSSAESGSSSVNLDDLLNFDGVVKRTETTGSFTPTLSQPALPAENLLQTPVLPLPSAPVAHASVHATFGAHLSQPSASSSVLPQRLTRPKAPSSSSSSLSRGSSVSSVRHTSRNPAEEAPSSPPVVNVARRRPSHSVSAASDSVVSGMGIGVAPPISHLSSGALNGQMNLQRRASNASSVAAHSQRSVSGFAARVQAQQASTPLGGGSSHELVPEVSAAEANVLRSQLQRARNDLDESRRLLETSRNLSSHAQSQLVSSMAEVSTLKAELLAMRVGEETRAAAIIERESLQARVTKQSEELASLHTTVAAFQMQESALPESTQQMNQRLRQAALDQREIQKLTRQLEDREQEIRSLKRQLQETRISSVAQNSEELPQGGGTITPSASRGAILSQGPGGGFNLRPSSMGPNRGRRPTSTARLTQSILQSNLNHDGESTPGGGPTHSGLDLSGTDKPFNAPPASRSPLRASYATQRRASVKDGLLTASSSTLLVASQDGEQQQALKEKLVAEEKVRVALARMTDSQQQLARTQERNESLQQEVYNLKNQLSRLQQQVSEITADRAHMAESKQRFMPGPRNVSPPPPNAISRGQNLMAAKHQNSLAAQGFLRVPLNIPSTPPESPKTAAPESRSTHAPQLPVEVQELQRKLQTVTELCSHWQGLVQEKQSRLSRLGDASVGVARAFEDLPDDIRKAVPVEVQTLILELEAEASLL